MIQSNMTNAMKPEDVPPEWMREAERAWNAVHATGITGACLRHALAAVAPLIAQAEREKCAALVDCGCAHKADVLAVRDENSGDRWRTCGQSPCGALEARAIRARGGEG